MVSDQYHFGLMSFELLTFDYKRFKYDEVYYSAYIQKQL